MWHGALKIFLDFFVLVGSVLGRERRERWEGGRLEARRPHNLGLRSTRPRYSIALALLLLSFHATRGIIMLDISVR